MRSIELFLVALLALSTFDPMKCARQNADPADSKLDIIQYDPQASLDQSRNLEKAVESLAAEVTNGGSAQPEQVEPLTSSCWCDKQKKDEREAQRAPATPNQVADAQRATPTSQRSKAVNVMTEDLPDGPVGVAGAVVEASAVDKPGTTSSSAQATGQVDELPAEKRTAGQNAPEDGATKRAVAAAADDSGSRAEEEKGVEEPREGAKASKRGKERAKKANKEEKKRSKRGAKDSSKRTNKDKGKRSAMSKDGNKKSKKNKGDKRK